MTVTAADVLAARAEHGGMRAAADALGISRQTAYTLLRAAGVDTSQLARPVPRPVVRVQPAEPEQVPAPSPAAPRRVLSVVVPDVDDDRVRVPGRQLLDTASTLLRARAALHAGDTRAADQLLGRATSSVVLYASLPSGSG